MSTDKDLLGKGLKTLGIAVMLMFSGPTLVYFVLGDQESPTFIPLIIIAFLLCIGAIIMGFKGINIIMTSIFKK